DRPPRPGKEGHPAKSARARRDGDGGGDERQKTQFAHSTLHSFLGSHGESGWSTRQPREVSATLRVLSRAAGEPMPEHRSEPLDRRQFMKRTAGVAAAATILPRHVLGGTGFVAPSDKVNVAIIGVGGQGRTNFRALAQEADCQVIALADPCEEW